MGNHCHLNDGLLIYCNQYEYRFCLLCLEPVTRSVELEAGNDGQQTILEFKAKRIPVENGAPCPSLLC